VPILSLLSSAADCAKVKAPPTLSFGGGGKGRNVSLAIPPLLPALEPPCFRAVAARGGGGRGGKRDDDVCSGEETTTAFSFAADAPVV